MWNVNGPAGGSTANKTLSGGRPHPTSITGLPTNNYELSIIYPALEYLLVAPEAGWKLNVAYLLDAITCPVSTE